ncbi:MAG: YebC/PmpR family DNA-binding transcriptional regulator, partial [Acetanaerobacterium sp.]
IAVIVETLTENRNRTAGDLRHYFDKYGGNLGAMGCVSFMFSQNGVIIVESEGLNEDKVMEDAMNAGATDLSFEDDVVEIYTEPNDLRTVREALETAGYVFLSAEVEYLPQTSARIEDTDTAAKMNRMLELMNDNDDVQNIWHNWENEDDFAEE